MNLLALSHPPRIGFTLLLCVGLGLLGVQLSQQQATDALAETANSFAQKNLLRLSHELAAHQQQTLTEIDHRLRAIAGLSLANTFDHSACNRLLARQLDTLAGIDNLVLIDSHGRIRCDAKPLQESLPSNFFNTSNLLNAQRAHLPRAHADKFTLAAPLLNSAGHEVGWVIAIASLAQWLQSSSMAIPASISLTLLDAQGQVLVADAPETLPLRELPIQQVGVSRWRDAAGEEYWQAAAPLPGPPRLTLLARQAAPTTLWEATSAIIGLAGLSLFMLAVIVGLHLAHTRQAPWWRALYKKYCPIRASVIAWLRTVPARLHGLNTLNLLRRSNADLKHALRCEEARAYQLLHLDQLNQTLLNCTNLRDAANAIARCAQTLLPDCGGALLLRTRPGVMQTAASWGQGAQHEYSRPQDCWAARLGHTYVVDQPLAAACCTHLKTLPPAPYLCVPLIAQGAMLGTLHLQTQAPHKEAAPTWLAELLAQRVIGAISRIQRETLLRAQATRDLLTGLHNRRFLEETFTLEETWAKRRGAPIGLMLLDIDHFKQFNDRFGHDAGDALLRALGRTIHSQVRKGDIACRFGGEEFVIVLPGADLDITVTRAEALRLAVRDLQVVHGEQALGQITISIGVACYPRHGSTCHSVLKVADQALYACKAAGRDRVLRPAPMLVTSV